MPPLPDVVVVGRDGDLVLPVDVRLTFENGQIWSTTWTAGEVDPAADVYGSKLARVDVDPDGRVVLDRSPWNNVESPGGSRRFGRCESPGLRLHSSRS